MEQYIIRGGTALNGEVEIGGAKNAALGILAAAIMTDEIILHLLGRNIAHAQNGGTAADGLQQCCRICGKKEESYEWRRFLQR